MWLRALAPPCPDITPTQSFIAQCTPMQMKPKGNSSCHAGEHILYKFQYIYSNTPDTVNECLRQSAIFGLPDSSNLDCRFVIY